MKEIHNEKFKNSFAMIKGKKIHYLSAGKKENPNIVILHGWASRAKIFEHLGLHLSEDHFVIIPDLPGCGQSETLEKASFKEIAGVILELLKEVKVDQVSVVAHSMGGGIGVEMAVLEPEKVKKLLLLSSSLKPIKRTFLDWASLSFWQNKKILSKSSYLGFFAVIFSLLGNFLFHPVWTSATFYLSTRSNLLRELKKIKVSPTVICSSEEEEFLPAINQVCHFLSIQPTLVKGSGHNWPVLEPHQAAEVIEQYV